MDCVVGLWFVDLLYVGVLFGGLVDGFVYFVG